MADRYWVGGSGNWSDDDNHWATTSGGSPSDGNLPTSADNAIFDSNSHSTDYTVTLNATANCLDWNIGSPASGNVTFNGDNTIFIYGSFSSASGTIFSGSFNMSLEATTSETITTNGVALDSLSTTTMSFNGTGSWTLTDDLTSTTRRIFFNRGTLDTDGFDITVSGFESNFNATRVIELNDSTITAGTFGVTIGGTGLTLNEGTSTIITNASNFSGGGETFYNVTLTNVTANGGVTIAGTNTFNNLTRTNASGYTQLLLAANQTVNGTFTVTGNNANTERILVTSDTAGTSRTITAAAVSLTNVDFQDITGAGAATWSGTSIGDAQGNSGITFTTPTTRYWDDDGGAWTDPNQWSASSGGGGGASVPLPQDTAVFDSNSFTTGGQSVTIGLVGFRLAKDITWTGVTNTPTWNRNTSHTVFGSITVVSGMTISGTSPTTLAGRGTHTITSDGNTFTNAFIIDSIGGTYTLQDAFTSSATFTLTNGAYDTNDFSHTSTTFVSNNTNARTLSLGSGTLTLTGTGAVWNFTTVTNLTLNEETSTIKLTNNGTGTKTFAGGGETYYNFWNATQNTGAVSVTGSNTFNNFRSDAGRTNTIAPSSTQTTSTMTASGTSGNETIIQSTAGSHTWTKAGGGVVSLEYMNIIRSNGSPSDTWYAANSTDGGNNTGWIFSAPPGGAPFIPKLTWFT